MNVLIACEFSGIVRRQFAFRGHYAVSCDLLDTEVACNPNLSEYHYKGDVRDLLGNHSFDMMIAFPPCTHLCVSGARWFKDKRKEQEEALDFVKMLMNANVDKIAIENPVGIISTQIRKPDQIIQPYWFGDPFEKTTCLWLKNLPPLQPTKILDRPERAKLSSGKTIPKWYSNAKHKDRAKIRSRTFVGIGKAMAEQWGN